MQAFVSQLKYYNSSYVPQYISREEFESIITSNHKGLDDYGKRGDKKRGVGKKFGRRFSEIETKF